MQVNGTPRPSSRHLVGKVAVVTASTDGIGLAIARRLAQEGAKVVVSSRKQKNVDRAVKDLKGDNLDVTGVVCHMASADDRRRLLSTAVDVYGGVDLLVSNAAVNPTAGPALDTTPAVWDKIFDINAKATFFLIKEAFPHMAKRGGGAIVLVSSIAAYQVADVHAAYCISKTSHLGMVRALLPQLTQANIRINIIAPGLIKTRFSSGFWNSPGSDDFIRDNIVMNRIGSPEECAGPTAFLLSDDASYITGETLVIAGGRFAHL